MSMRNLAYAATSRASSGSDSPEQSDVFHCSEGYQLGTTIALRATIAVKTVRVLGRNWQR